MGDSLVPPSHVLEILLYNEHSKEQLSICW